jgi:hypothetical protein
MKQNSLNKLRASSLSFLLSMDFSMAMASEQILKQIEDEIKHWQTKRYNQIENQTEKQRADNSLKQKGIFAKYLLNLRMIALPVKN